VAKLVLVYLSRVEARLSKQLSASEVSEHIDELTFHLRESINDQVSRGESEDAATVQSLRAIGSDRLVADSLIRARTGINARSSWRFAWLSVIILLLYGLVPLTFFYLEPVPDWLLTYTSWLPTFFAVSFAYACWRSRRALFAPIAVTATILFAATMIEVVAFSPVGYTSFSSRSQAHTIAGFQRNITDFEKQIQFAKSGLSSRPYPASLRQSSYFMAPKPEVVAYEGNVEGLPFSTETGRNTIIALMPCTSEREARGLWAQFGTQYAVSLEGSVRYLKSNQDHWRKAKQDPKEIGMAAIRSLEAYALIFAVIMALNLFVIGLAAIHRKAIALVWRPERLA